MDRMSYVVVLVVGLLLGFVMCYFIATAFRNRPAKAVRVALAALVGGAVGGIAAVTATLFVTGPGTLHMTKGQLVVYLGALAMATLLGAGVAVRAVVRSNNSLERTRDR